MPEALTQTQRQPADSWPCGYNGCDATIDTPIRNSHARVVTVICTGCSEEHDVLYDRRLSGSPGASAARRVVAAGEYNTADSYDR